jgi:hypothetical protein
MQLTDEFAVFHIPIREEASFSFVDGDIWNLYVYSLKFRDIKQGMYNSHCTIPCINKQTNRQTDKQSNHTTNQTNLESNSLVRVTSKEDVLVILVWSLDFLLVCGHESVSGLNSVLYNIQGRTNAHTGRKREIEREEEYIRSNHDEVHIIQNK